MEGLRKFFFREHPEALQEMLALRASNKKRWSLSGLARRYGVHHTSIIYQCFKHGLGEKRKEKPRKHEGYCKRCGVKLDGAYETSLRQEYGMHNGTYCGQCLVERAQEPK